MVIRPRLRLVRRYPSQPRNALFYIRIGLAVLTVILIVIELFGFHFTKQFTLPTNWQFAECISSGRWDFYYDSVPAVDGEQVVGKIIVDIKPVRRYGFLKKLVDAEPEYELVSKSGKSVGKLYRFEEKDGFSWIFTPDRYAYDEVDQMYFEQFPKTVVVSDGSECEFILGSYFKTDSDITSVRIGSLTLTVVRKGDKEIPETA